MCALRRPLTVLLYFTYYWTAHIYEDTEMRNEFIISILVLLCSLVVDAANINSTIETIICGENQK